MNCSSKNFLTLHIINENIDVLQEIINEGTDINLEDKDGTTPLQIAAAYGCNKVIKLLINNKAQIDKANDLGWTPLMHAARNGHSSTVEKLIKYGADINLKNDIGSEVMCLAVASGSCRTVKQVLRAAPREYAITPLITAVLFQHSHLIKMLLNFSSPQECVKDTDMTALMMAALTHNAAVTEALLSCVDHLQSNVLGQSAFDIAQLTGNVAFLQSYEKYKKNDEVTESDSQVSTQSPSSPCHQFLNSFCRMETNFSHKPISGIKKYLPQPSIKESRSYQRHGKDLQFMPLRSNSDVCTGVEQEATEISYYSQSIDGCIPEHRFEEINFVEREIPAENLIETNIFKTDELNQNSKIFERDYKHNQSKCSNQDNLNDICNKPEPHISRVYIDNNTTCMFPVDNNNSTKEPEVSKAGYCTSSHCDPEISKSIINISKNAQETYDINVQINSPVSNNGDINRNKTDIKSSSPNISISVCSTGEFKPTVCVSSPTSPNIYVSYQGKNLHPSSPTFSNSGQISSPIIHISFDSNNLLSLDKSGN